MPDVDGCGEGCCAAREESGFVFGDDVDVVEVVSICPQENGPEGAFMIGGNPYGAGLVAAECCA